MHRFVIAVLHDVMPFIVGVNLTAFIKKNYGIWPIAIGETLSHLTIVHFFKSKRLTVSSQPSLVLQFQGELKQLFMGFV